MASFLHDDDAHTTLEAALAFIDEFYHDDDAESVEKTTQKTSGNEKSSDEEVKHRQTARNSNAKPGTASSRGKESVKKLRETAEELENELNALRGSRSQRRQTKEKAWEGIAKRQQTQRERSVVQNVKLREIIVEQLRLARNLDALFRKRRSADLAMSNALKDDYKRPRILPGGASVISEDLKQELVDILNTLYPQVDCVFADPRFDRLTREEPQRLVQLRVEDGVNPVFESLTSWRLPFNYSSAAGAVWGMLCGLRGDEEVDQEETEVIDGKMPLPSGGRLRTKMTYRRFVEPDRVVIVGVMAIDVSPMNATSMKNVYVRMRAWHVLYPSQTTEADGEPSSWWRTFHIFELESTTKDEMLANPEFRRLLIGGSNFVVDHIKASIDMRNQTIENRLLSDVINLKVQ
ncbi:hypothetical protein Poli38472_004892 [Pythium oligandrum]|uniref:Uncharacterized protein n=1 Tax=Pythium oligandrum TaxID=41045 RepID=A0A8K1CB99_PYTOL|nr:hypothetical protein Poli38472_004892 [Pythium oligandrum]|eukprot:TMW59823.1 hypothetical protein Poli38472_004892 [Pythium oligandrum]